MWICFILFLENILKVYQDQYPHVGSQVISPSTRASSSSPGGPAGYLAEVTWLRSNPIQVTFSVDLWLRVML